MELSLTPTHGLLLIHTTIAQSFARLSSPRNHSCGVGGLLFSERSNNNRISQTEKRGELKVDID